MVSRRSHGFTLIELTVTLAILAFLSLAVVPLTLDWVRGARTLDARGKLVEAYGTAKAVAQRNPERADSTSAEAAAGLRIVQTDSAIVMTVCAGAPTETNCQAGATNVLRTSTLPASLQMTVGTQTLAAAAPILLSLDNRGAASASTTFTIRSGGSQNDETGTLF